MSLDRLRYEVRLLGRSVILTPLLVTIGFALLLIIVNRNVKPEVIARSMGAGLEVLLPLAAGVVVATVATYDRAIELQLTLPLRYHRTANLRFFLILLWSGIVSLLTSLCLALFNYWRMPLQIADWSQPWQFLVWQLNWLAPTLWLVALGLVLSLLIRSRSASGALICVISLGEMLAHDDLNSNALLHPLYLFLLTFSPNANYWLVNRSELIGTAVVLLIVAWFLLHLPELLLSHAPGEE